MDWLGASENLKKNKKKKKRTSTSLIKAIIFSKLLGILSTFS
jgi:hypothetical protein